MGLIVRTQGEIPGVTQGTKWTFGKAVFPNGEVAEIRHGDRKPISDGKRVKVQHQPGGFWTVVRVED